MNLTQPQAANDRSMSHIHGFPPLCGDAPKILILGSMPGKASLRASEYYAFPRNAFWQIMRVLIGIDEDQPYRARCDMLQRQGIAVWDVLQACTRVSSLDADIDSKTIVTNDFAGFLSQHASIQAVYFNGATAEQLYRRHVLATLPGRLSKLELNRLPSTSPAHAAMSFESKLAAWRQILDYASRLDP